MFVLIVGCGRVGSAIATSMMEEGHEVSVLDEDAEAIALLDRGQDQSW
jgi:trk system potassium uptake protein TrkA